MLAEQKLKTEISLNKADFLLLQVPWNCNRVQMFCLRNWCDRQKRMLQISPPSYLWSWSIFSFASKISTKRNCRWKTVLFIRCIYSIQWKWKQNESNEKPHQSCGCPKCSPYKSAGCCRMFLCLKYFDFSLLFAPKSQIMLNHTSAAIK